MLPGNRVTVKNIDVFLFMLKQDKSIDKDTELYLDCIEYPKQMSASFSTKMHKAISTKTNYSKIGFDLTQSSYSDYLEEVFDEINGCSVNLELDFSFFDGNNILKLTKIIANMLARKNSFKDLTIILSNCNIRDAEILIFAEALSWGECPPGLNLKFNNKIVSTPSSSRKNNITNDGIRTIIAAIRSTKCPRDVQLDFANNDQIDNILIEEMNNAIAVNNKKHDALACITLQQGLMQKNSPLKKFPQDVANMIYGYIVPSPMIFKTYKKIRKIHTQHGDAVPIEEIKQENKKPEKNCILM